MKIIEFFGLKVKPRLTRGKYMFKPIDTQALSDSLFCIRDKDVNCFLYKTENGYLAIDSGYKNSSNIRNGLKSLHIPPEKVHTVFLTHLDIDHAGGMDADAGEIFPNAIIYLSAPENEYLKGNIFRKEIGPIHCRMPIRLKEDRKLLKDREILLCDGVEIEAIYAPGHSAGHTVYRIQDSLFSADCMISDGNKGWCFYDFWNWNTEINKKTLQKLDAYCRSHSIQKVITSHSGILPSDAAFQCFNICPDWKAKGFHFIADGEEDVYRE